MISKKGFTLFEILLVITIIAIISIAALTTSVNTQRQFVFINTFKELLAKVREARLYTVTQKSVDLGTGETGIPSAYGVHIEKDGTKIVVKIFADLADIEGGSQNEYDITDTTIGHIYSLDSEKYTLKVLDKTYDSTKTEELNAASVLVNLNDQDTSLTLLYPPGEIKITASYKIGDASTIIQDPYMYLSLEDEALRVTKNISIFLRSGIAEEIQDFSQIAS
jgi:prepilin-type N-terminal cleavage/methylation domain-containing protein